MQHFPDPRIQQQRPPLPDAGDQPRRDHSRLRRRLLEGWWRQDLDRRISEFFHSSTAERLGYRDMSRNLFRQLTLQLSQLYTDPPRIEHEGVAEDPLDEFRAQLRDAWLWQVLARNQRYSVGMRESLVRVGWIPGEPGGLQFRMVPSDLVWASAHPDRPGNPDQVVEARIRTLTRNGKQETAWTWDVLDVREEPSYKVMLPDGPDPSKASDITADVLGGDFSGSDYPYIADGEAVLPHVLYHASGGTGSLWDAWTGKEQVDATLIVAVFWTFWGYCVRDASHPIRGMANGIMRGAATRGSSKGSRSEVPADPTTMLMIDSDGPGPVQALQWAAGSDPSGLQLAIDSYEQRALLSAGIAPSDLQASGAAQSGYAIALKREVVRERQRALLPQMEAGDRQVLALAAALTNRHTGSSLPESEWNLRYSQISLTAEERKSRIEEARAGIELGTRSLVDVVLAENPGWTRDEASDWLQRVRAEQAQFPRAV